MFSKLIKVDGLQTWLEICIIGLMSCNEFTHVSRGASSSVVLGRAKKLFTKSSRQDESSTSVRAPIPAKARFLQICSTPFVYIRDTLKLKIRGWGSKKRVIRQSYSFYTSAASPFMPTTSTFARRRLLENVRVKLTM